MTRLRSPLRLSEITFFQSLQVLKKPPKSKASQCHMVLLSGLSPGSVTFSLSIIFADFICFESLISMSLTFVAE